MKALELLEDLKEYPNRRFLDSSLNEAIKELEDLQKNTQVITDDKRTLKDFVFTNCNECINKVDNHFTETCFSCKRYYGCYFEKRETK
ncbi:hypothetical protein N5T79_06450 [Aliarcobacter cryaerophilus]|uniref:hypothetical protein n=1 Tax=Aliarcobacter cryaerophilus TaxID=28198 RepID=UPI0021B4E414|nr:hypothetical protein [Aliarcobacter cryaerophilus]MCT7528782.1 hypothetical protein [Aliarcobacter cryaerophilus]